LPQRDYGRFISQTTNTTNYVTINNYVVNRSIDVNRLPRETSQRFQPVAASTVIGRDAVVTQAATGREVEQRERQRQTCGREGPFVATNGHGSRCEMGSKSQTQTGKLDKQKRRPEDRRFQTTIG
jgi:hypothetical protein